MRRSGRSRSIYRWALFLVGLSMAMPVAGWIWSAFEDAPTAPPPAPRKLTEADLDAGLLLRLQDELVTAQVARTQEALKANGLDEQLPPPKVSSTYVAANGHKFGVVRSTLGKEDKQVQLVLVVGLVDGRLKRVACVSQQGEVQLGSGRCAEKLADTFGTIL